MNINCIVEKLIPTNFTIVFDFPPDSIVKLEVGKYLTT